MIKSFLHVYKFNILNILHFKNNIRVIKYKYKRLNFRLKRIKN